MFHIQKQASGWSAKARDLQCLCNANSHPVLQPPSAQPSPLLYRQPSSWCYSSTSPARDEDRHRTTQQLHANHHFTGLWTGEGCSESEKQDSTSPGMRPYTCLALQHQNHPGALCWLMYFNLQQVLPGLVYTFQWRKGHHAYTESSSALCF